MACSKAVLLYGLLLACLAAAVSARGRPAAEEFFQCPDTTKFKGCAAKGCVLLMSGRTSSLVCAKCPNNDAYVLVNDGTRTAKCECVAGYAGKGLDGVCKKCPAGTEIAEGGPLRSSVCLKCPKGSTVNAEGTDCLCPAGHYRAAAEQPAGIKRIACKPCTARTAFVEKEGHSFESCSTCKAPQVANKAHTACVAPDDEDAAPPSEGLFGALAGRVSGDRASGSTGGSALSSLAKAFEGGRQEGEEQRLMRQDARQAGSSNPMFSFVGRVRSAVSGDRKDKAAAAKEDEADAAAEGDSKKAARSKAGSSSSSRKEAVAEAEAQAEEEHKKQDPIAPEADVVAADKADAAAADKADVSTPEPVEEPPVAAKDAKAAEPEDVKQDDAPAAAATPTPSKADSSAAAGKKEDTTSSSSSSKKEEEQPSSKKEEEPSSKKEAPAAQKPSEKPSTEDKGAAQAPSDSISIPKLDLAKLNPELAREEGMMDPEPAAEPKAGSKSKAASPSSPPTIMDMAKKLGEAMGASGVARGPPVMPGYVDPAAMADAGLPPINNLGGLVNALVAKQLNGLDLSEWSEGLLNRGDSDSRSFN